MCKIPARPTERRRIEPTYVTMWKSLTLTALATLLASCIQDVRPVLEVTVSDLPTPAGPDSGEPFLSASGDAVYLSWLEEGPSGGHDLRFARLHNGVWDDSGVIAHSERFFVNWADFPSLTAAGDGTLWAHWLERGPTGGYDYGVRIVRSDDGGVTWSDPWTPHEDGTRTEHGFVSTIELDGTTGFVWLDGRNLAPDADASRQERAMALRYRSLSTAGEPGPETLLDERVCECCQTDAAVATSGPVVVYRNRSIEEIRDVYVTRLVDGAWSEGRAVHADGWEIGGCPVNGPAVAARGDDVAVAWFTGAGDEPRVQVAFSTDGAASFGDPVRVDGGLPVGRVDILLLRDSGAALVSWLEGTGGEGAEVRIRLVDRWSGASEAVTLTHSSAERASGFPRVMEAPDGSVLLAWTDVTGEDSRVRLKRMEVEGP